MKRLLFILITLIIVYLIYRIAKANDWRFLSFITGAYLVVIIGFIALVVLAITLLILIPLVMLKKPGVFRKSKKRPTKIKSKIDDDAIDVDFKVKD